MDTSTTEPKTRFDSFLRGKGLRRTPQRDAILDAFLSTTRHVSAQELFDLVRQHDNSIGYATVARTLNLMVESGISWIVDFNDGVRRYDHKFGCMRHDHIICMECHNCVEVFDESLERIKRQLAERFGYTPKYAKLDIFGLCPTCRGRIHEKDVLHRN
jgi:Fur family transcriptional regulator, ferric uptake regulator